MTLFNRVKQISEYVYYNPLYTAYISVCVHQFHPVYILCSHRIVLNLELETVCAGVNKQVYIVCFK